MSFRESLALAWGVVLTPEVIGAAVVILFFLNLVFYVASYRKRQKKAKDSKRKAGRSRAAKSAKSAAASAPSGGEEEAPA